ncbi:MAG: ATP-binding protein, partial [Candidatus Sulfotelmatobacter sp.]
IEDITEQKRVAGALAEQSEELSRQAAELTRSRQGLETQTLMLQSVLDSISEGLVAADETGKFLLWNPAATRIVGLGAANVPPEQWSNHYGVFLPDTITLFPPDQNPLVRAIRGEPSTAEMYLRNPELDTGVWIEISGNPLRDKNGVARGGVVAFRDVTQRRADEREIRKLNDELEARVIERTAALQVANHELEAFTYSVSHDLRAPLRHISGFSRILVEDFAPSLPPEAQHHLQRIAQGAARMGTLVDELLNLARVGRQSLTVQPTGLSSIVQDVLLMLEPEIAGRNVEWKIADLPVMECDPTLVRQVFQNLLHNALKYSRPRSPAVIEIGQTEKNGQPVIFVRDNGVGFSMKYADKLFGVFQRLHRAEEFEGTGVGLATVQRIVHKHGGRVWAEAEIDRGATFYFTLGSLERSESKTIAAAAASGGRK